MSFCFITAWEMDDTYSIGVDLQFGLLEGETRWVV